MLPTKKSLEEHIKMRKLPPLPMLPIILEDGVSYEEAQRLLGLIDEVPIIKLYWKNLNKLHEWWENTDLPHYDMEEEAINQYYAFEDECDEIYEKERKKYSTIIKASTKRPTAWVPDFKKRLKHPSKLSVKEMRRRERLGEVLRPQPKGPMYLEPDLFYLKMMPPAQIDYILNNLSLYPKLSEKRIASIKLEKEKIKTKTDGWHP